jgi:hypothetical protein
MIREALTSDASDDKEVAMGPENERAGADGPDPYREDADL